MKLAAMVRTFVADHFRTTAVLTELVFILIFLLIFLDPRGMPYTWSQLAVTVTIMAIVISAMSASILVWRNADQKVDVLVLKAGRMRYYLGIFIAAVLISVFWMATILAYIYLFLSPGFAASQLLALLTAMVFITVTVSALFLLFSLLTGKNYELCFAVTLVILGLNTPYFANLGEPWRLIAIFLPPLQENIHAVSNNLALPLAKSPVYVIAVLALGLLRFTRREFMRS